MFKINSWFLYISLYVSLVLAAFSRLDFYPVSSGCPRGSAAEPGAAFACFLHNR